MQNLLNTKRIHPFSHSEITEYKSKCCKNQGYLRIPICSNLVFLFRVVLDTKLIPYSSFRLVFFPVRLQSNIQVTYINQYAKIQDRS